MIFTTDLLMPYFQQTTAAHFHTLESLDDLTILVDGCLFVMEIWGIYQTLRRNLKA